METTTQPTSKKAKLESHHDGNVDGHNDNNCNTNTANNTTSDNSKTTSGSDQVDIVENR